MINVLHFTVFIDTFQWFIFQVHADDFIQFKTKLNEHFWDIATVKIALRQTYWLNAVVYANGWHAKGYRLLHMNLTLHQFTHWSHLLIKSKFTLKYFRRFEISSQKRLEVILPIWNAFIFMFDHKFKINQLKAKNEFPSS